MKQVLLFPLRVITVIAFGLIVWLMIGIGALVTIVEDLMGDTDE